MAETHRVEQKAKDNKFEKFLQALRRKATVANYRWGLTCVLHDPDAFLESTEQDRK